MASNSVILLLSLLAAAIKTGPAPRYDPATVVDLPVVVTEVRETGSEDGLNGIRLSVRTEADSTIDVYLGPANFVKGFEITFTKGDRIQVIGSKIKFAGGSIVLAREVRKDSATLYLRNHNGDPYWR